MKHIFFWRADFPPSRPGWTNDGGHAGAGPGQASSALPGQGERECLQHVPCGTGIKYSACYKPPGSVPPSVTTWTKAKAPTFPSCAKYRGVSFTNYLRRYFYKGYNFAFPLQRKDVFHSVIRGIRPLLLCRPIPPQVWTLSIVV